MAGTKLIKKASDDTKLPLAGGTMTGSIDMDGSSVESINRIYFNGHARFINDMIDDDSFSSGVDAQAVASAESIKAYVDANAGGASKYSISSSLRFYTKYLYWHYTHLTYGQNYYHANKTFSDSSLETTWHYGDLPTFTVPYDGTITGYIFSFEPTSSQTYEAAVLKGTPAYSVAANTSLSQVGSTQSQVATNGRRYLKSEDDLSVSVSMGDIIVCSMRRSTSSSSSTYYLYTDLTILLEAD